MVVALWCDVLPLSWFDGVVRNSRVHGDAPSGDVDGVHGTEVRFCFNV